MDEIIDEIFEKGSPVTGVLESVGHGLDAWKIIKLISMHDNARIYTSRTKIVTPCTRNAVRLLKLNKSY